MLYNEKGPIATRVIDSNSKIDDIVARLREESNRPKARERAQSEDDADAASGLVFTPLIPGMEGAPEGEAAEGESEESGNIIKASAIAQQEAMAKEQAARIIEAAKDKAAEILMDAKAQAESEADGIRQSAHDEGFSKGVSDGKTQMDAMSREKEAEFAARTAALEEEYAGRFEAIEGDVVGAVISVFEKVFGLELTGSEDVLVHLVKGTIMEADNAKEFHIRVSRDDVAGMREHLDEFKACVGNDCMLEILSDNSLTSGQCLIETEGGVFDCGAELQMQNIFRNLRALSGY